MVGQGATDPFFFLPILTFTAIGTHKSTKHGLYCRVLVWSGFLFLHCRSWNEKRGGCLTRVVVGVPRLRPSLGTMPRGKFLGTTWLERWVAGLLLLQRVAVLYLQWAVVSDGLTGG